MSNGPQLVDQWRSSAAALQRTGDLLGAAEAIRRAIALRPDDAAIHCDLAVLLQLSGRLEESRQEYLRAIELQPSHRTALYNLGCLYNTADREAEAIACFRRTIEFDPEHAASHHNLGQALLNLGETDAAIAQYRRAIELGAGAPAETMLAMSIGISPTAAPSEVLQVRRDWAKRRLPVPMFTHSQPVSAEANRPLRIGYVSAFFDQPNWMKPVWTLINRHNRERFALFLYSDGDGSTPPGYVAQPNDRFLETARLSPAELAKLIAGHDLDLLVDLNGFSRVPRLAVFALRPRECRSVGSTCSPPRAWTASTT